MNKAPTLWQPRKRYRGWKAAQLGVGGVLVLLFWWMGITMFANEPAFRIAGYTDRLVLFALSFGAALFGTWVWLVSVWTRVIAHWPPVRRFLLARGVDFEVTSDR